MKLSIHDPECCHYQVRVNKWDLTWGITVLEANTDASLATVVYREETDGPVVPIDQIALATEGYTWFDGQLIAIEEMFGNVELVPAETLTFAQQVKLAAQQGRVDISAGRSNWGGSHYPRSYDLRDAYDLGYRMGPFR